MADVLAYLDDIFFQAKVAETAKHVGVEVRACTTLESFAQEIAAAKPRLVIVDLNARTDPFGAVESAKTLAGDIPLIVYLSHVQTDLAERARAAGCANIMARSKFTRDLATILAGAKSQS
jgi:DNA-binding NarL/FixJ family response regulator